MPLVNSDLDQKFSSKINTCIAPIQVHMNGIFNFILDHAMIVNFPNNNFPKARC